MSLPTLYYVDSQGIYLGGFSGSMPSNGIVVASAPSKADQTWNFSTSKWSSIPTLELDADDVTGINSIIIKNSDPYSRTRGQIVSSSSIGGGFPSGTYVVLGQITGLSPYPSTIFIRVA